MAFEELNYQFISIFENVKATLTGVAGIAFLGLQAAGSLAWKRYTQRKLDKVMRILMGRQTKVYPY